MATAATSGTGCTSSDHCRGIDLILQKGRPGEVYNIGGGVGKRESEAGRDAAVRVADEAFAEPRRSASRFPNCPAPRGGKASSLVRFVKDRPGPRSPLCDRLRQDRAGAGVSGAGHSRRRAAEHLRLVYRERVVVARGHGRQLSALDRDALSVRAGSSSLPPAERLVANSAPNRRRSRYNRPFAQQSQGILIGDSGMARRGSRVRWVWISDKGW